MDARPPFDTSPRFLKPSGRYCYYRRRLETLLRARTLLKATLLAGDANDIADDEFGILLKRPSVGSR